MIQEQTKLVKKENYVVLQGWMVSELGLKGNELIIYAIIYGFSQITGTSFKGSLNYLSDWTNTSKQSVITQLKNLVGKGLIEKREIVKNNVKFCEYVCSQNILPVVKNFEQGWSKNLNGGSQNILPNNINNNIDNNIDNKRTKNTSEKLEEKLPEIIKNLNLDEEYVELTRSWIKYKRDLKEGYKSEFSLIAFVKRLAEFSNNQPEVARRVIEQSFERNWKTVYKLQENSFKGKPVTSNEINYKCDFIQPDGTFYNPYL